MIVRSKDGYMVCIKTDSGFELIYSVLDKDTCIAYVMCTPIDAHGIKGNAQVKVSVEYQKDENKFVHCVDLYDEEGFVEHYHEDFDLYFNEKNAQGIHTDLFELFNTETDDLLERLITAYLKSVCYLSVESGEIRFYNGATENEEGEVNDVAALYFDTNVGCCYALMDNEDRYQINPSSMTTHELKLIFHYLQEVFPL